MPTACVICSVGFEPKSSMHRVCGYRCAVSLAKRSRKASQEAKKGLAEALRKRKEAVKTRSEWLREAQTAFNAYIRVRDAELPCISCGRHHNGQWHSGHFMSTGARPNLRFDEHNVWKQCQPCNTHLHGNLLLYRAELIRRIGLAEVERLENDQTTRKYTVDELREIRNHYRAKAKR